MEFWTNAEIITAIAGGIGAIVAAVVAGIKRIIKKLESVIQEVKPNHGSSMKDQVSRLEEKFENKIAKIDRMEAKLDQLYDFIMSKFD